MTVNGLAQGIYGLPFEHSNVLPWEAAISDGTGRQRLPASYRIGFKLFD